MDNTIDQLMRSCANMMESMIKQNLQGLFQSTSPNERQIGLLLQ